MSSSPFSLRHHLFILGTISALALSLLSPALPSSAATIDEHWEAPVTTSANQLGVIFDDRVDYSYVGALAGAVNEGGWQSRVCSSIQDAHCANAAYFSFKAMLGPCALESDTNCLESLIAIKSDGTRVTGKFSRYATTDKSTYFDGTTSLDIPSSRSESLWTFEGINHGGGSDFLVSSILDGTYKKGSQAKFDRLQSFVQPVSEIKDSSVSRIRIMDTPLSFMSEEYVQNQTAWTGGQRGTLGKNCAATDDGVCFQREPFPADLKFALKIRTPQSIGGWIHGRMKSPDVSIEGSGNKWTIEVTGEPIPVPVVAYWGNRSELSPEILQAYSSRAGTYFTGNSVRYQTNGNFNQEQIDLFSLWIPYIKDKANANPKMWLFGSLTPERLIDSARGLGTASACLTNAKGLTGIVTTNATIYNGAMPTFSASDGVLNYKVSAPHYAADGSDFQGSYDLVLRSDIARCIYQFSSAPISATVNVTSSDGGVQRVASTVLSESKGWLHLGAYGFGFSAPTVKMKLIQEKATPVVVTVPSPTPVAAPIAPAPVIAKVISPAPASKTITCVKGKTTKKVSGIKPVCPAGYKKK